MDLGLRLGAVETAAVRGRGRAKLPPSLAAEAVLKGVGHPLTVASLRELMRREGHEVAYRTLYNALAKKPRTFVRAAGHTWTLVAA